MLNLNHLKKFCGVGTLASVSLLMTTNPASALKITIDEGTPFTKVENATTITFDGATTNAILGNSGYTEDGVTYTGLGRVVKNSVGGRYAAPPSQGSYSNVNNNYLSLGNGTDEPGPVTINFNVDADYFGFYYGSIDAYNYIKFFDGDNLIADLSGTDIRENANGDQSVAGARYLNFFAEGSERFDRVVLSSTKPAFETDNHSYRSAAKEVPTPAALLPVLSGMFMGAVRRKKTETKV